MIRSAKDFTASNYAAARAIASCVILIQAYTTHKDSSCVDTADECPCGLNLIRSIAEERLERFKASLTRVSEG